MESHSILAYFPLLLSFLPIPLGCAKPLDNLPTNLINQTCQTCARTMSPDISLNFCISSLTAVPVSHVTNLGGLGLVAMELALQNTTNTVKIISKMLENTSVSHCHSCLESCLELYSAMDAKLEDCISAFMSEQYNNVYMWVSVIMQATSICEESFKGEGEKSPLTKENYSVNQLSGIVLCIIDLISQANSQVSGVLF